MKVSLVFGRLLVVWLALPGLTACRERAPSGPAVPASSAPAARIESLAPPPQPYQPPKDGKLVPRQLEQYLAVRDRIRLALRQGGAQPTGPHPELDGAAVLESRAAASAGVPLEEYLWVREKVLEADAAGSAARQNADLLAMLEKTVGELRDRKAKAVDEGSSKLLGEQLASFEDELGRIRKEARERDPEAVRANLKLLEGFRTRLGPLQEEIDRLRAERVRPRPAPTAPAAPPAGEPGAVPKPA